MPSKRKDRKRSPWKGQVKWEGQTYRKQFPSRQAAELWEIQKKRELAGEDVKAAIENPPEGISPYLCQWLSDMEERLITLVKAEIHSEKGLRGSQKKAVDDPKAKCPLPPKTGKKYHGGKTDLRARMDSNLFKLFEAEAKRDHGGNLSRMLDQVVWSYFGQPPLSFETPDIDTVDQEPK
ncbi:MAG: hypothetical protein ACLQPD_04360 [Desulfomonilaceae bacterium]